MRQFSLCVLFLGLSLCGTVSAQEALVEHQEKDDPCAPFKMRILVPGNHLDFRRKPTDELDYKMVWNPCPQAKPQFVFALVEPPPQRLGDSLTRRSVGFQFPKVTNRKRLQAEFRFPQ